MSNENYLSAGKKHHNDAHYLFAAKRFDNCAYLSGYVVECGLKALLTTQNTIRPQSLGHSLENISVKALQLAAFLAPARSRMDLPTSQDYLDLLTQWNPSERYLAEGQVSHALAESKIEAANEVFSKIVIPLILDRVNP